MSCWPMSPSTRTLHVRVVSTTTLWSTPLSAAVQTAGFEFYGFTCFEIWSDIPNCKLVEELTSVIENK